MVRKSYKQNKLSEIIYNNIKDEINPDSLKAFATIAYRCLKRDHEQRPSMNEIVRELVTTLIYQTSPPPPPPPLPSPPPPPPLPLAAPSQWSPEFPSLSIMLVRIEVLLNGGHGSYLIRRGTMVGLTVALVIKGCDESLTATQPDTTQQAGPSHSSLPQALDSWLKREVKKPAGSGINWNRSGRQIDKSKLHKGLVSLPEDLINNLKVGSPFHFACMTSFSNKFSWHN
ncbi:hypothetical protein L1887_27966 [Cichorium endivia]|nr:hypothetical protein L1887_27966 [Cichorium endivia]